MPKKAVERLEAALTLPEAERAEIAELLAESIRPGSARLHPQWEGELRRRADELDSGAVRGRAEVISSKRKG